MNIFPESSFFKERRAPTLPTPAEIRAINEAAGRSTDFHRPPPVTIPSLGLFVKYGADVTAVEAQTQIMVRKQLKGRVPVPEVFGWTQDKNQRFIYMSLIEGETLQEKWCDLNEDERQAICVELKRMVKAWRALETDAPDCYIGSLCKQPLNDIFLSAYPSLVGPFEGADAVQKFHDACGFQISGEEPIVFTHNDLVAPNILLSPGPDPKVAAIIDWNQSGWYPAYWEVCKARWVGLVSERFNNAVQEEWRTKYLPRILDSVNDMEYWNPWVFSMLSKI